MQQRGVPQRATVPRSVPLTCVLAVFVTVAALLGVLLAHRGAQRTTGIASSGTASGGAVDCATDPRCNTVGPVHVADSAVELLIAPAGTAGTLRVESGGSVAYFPLSVPQLGVALTADSLSCLTSAPPACLVQGRGDQGQIGQLFLEGSSGWSSAKSPYISDGGFLAVRRLSDSPRPVVLLLQHRCDALRGPQCAETAVHGRVFAPTRGGADTTDIGCTFSYRSPQDVPGVHQTVLPRSQVKHSRCPAG
ncbi:MAG: hypothetical protein ACRDQ1_14685 [Sciscionella sp.]